MKPGSEYGTSLPHGVLEGCVRMGAHRDEHHYLYREGELVVQADQLDRLQALPRVALGEPGRPVGDDLAVIRVDQRRLLPRLVSELRSQGLAVAPHHVFRLASHIRVNPAGAPHDTRETLPPQGPPPPPDQRVRVALLDTGVRLDHPFFQGRCAGDPEDPACQPEPGRKSSLFCGHGTFVAGMILQRAPAATIISKRVMDANGLVTDEKLSAALAELEADPTIQVINVSAGGHLQGDPGELREMLQTSRQIRRMLKRRPDLVFVAAAGNDGSSLEFYPAALPEVIGVAAVEPSPGSASGRKACFSNSGDWVKASAMGVERLSTYLTYKGNLDLSTFDPPLTCRNGPWGPDDGQRDFKGYARWSGTSFATPVVTAEVVRRLRSGQSGRRIRQAFSQGSGPSGLGQFVPG
jgi:thermitase